MGPYRHESCVILDRASKRLEQLELDTLHIYVEEVDRWRES